MAVNEYFIKLLKLEKKKKCGFFDQIWGRLIEISLFNCQKLYEDADLDFEELKSQIDSYYSILNYINGLDSPVVFKYLLGIVLKNIESAEEVNKLIGLIVFESLLEFSKKSDLEQYIHQGFFSLLGCLKIGSKKVQLRTSSFFAKAAMFYPNVFLNEQNSVRYLPEICFLLQRSQDTDEDIYFKFNLCESLREVIISLKDYKPSNSTIHMFTDKLYSALNDIILTSNNLPLIDYAGLIIFEINNCLLDKNNYSRYFVELSKIFSNVYQNFNKEPQIRKFVLELYLINLNIIISLMRKENVILKVDDRSSSEFLQEIFLYIERITQQTPELRYESSILLSNIVCFDKNMPISFAQSLFRNSILNSLRDYKNISSFKAVLNSLTNFIQSYKEIAEPEIEGIIKFLLEILQDPSVSKELYIYIFRTFADIAFNYKEISFRYLDNMLHYMILGMDVVRNLSETKRKDLSAFLEGFKNTLLEFFHAILFIYYLEGNLYNEHFVKLFLKIQDFIKFFTTREMNPTFYFIKESLLTIYDFWLKYQSFECIDIELIRYLKDIVKGVESQNAEISQILAFINQLESQYLLTRH